MPALPASPAIITNIGCEVEEDGSGASLVTIQSTQALVYRFVPGDPWRPALAIDGTTVFPDSHLPVHDGLIQEIGWVREQGLVRLELELARPSGLAIRQYAGLPHLLCLAVDRRPLRRSMNNRRIFLVTGLEEIDPEGRRSADPPMRGKALETAEYLAERLSGLGSRVSLSRRGDRPASLGRLLARAVEQGADVIVALHMSRHQEPSLRGFRVLWHTKSGLALAWRVHQALAAKLGSPDRVMGPGCSWEAWTGKPAIAVDFAAIGNAVERSWLRGPFYPRRIAGGIANGICQYFYAAGHSPSRGPCANPGDRPDLICL